MFETVRPAESHLVGQTLLVAESAWSISVSETVRLPESECLCKVYETVWIDESEDVSQRVSNGLTVQIGGSPSVSEKVRLVELERVRQGIRNCLTGRIGSWMVKVFWTVGLPEIEMVGHGVRKGPTGQIVVCVWRRLKRFFWSYKRVDHGVGTCVSVKGKRMTSRVGKCSVRCPKLFDSPSVRL